ncbi:MAG TPA: LamB/YcsF family protein, partial [Sediminibacterium sp.]|nr:LamB/YcsF family protein [Sediminibacterium sp.]
DNGRLTPRSQNGSLIESGEASIRQVLQMVQAGTVTSINGKILVIEAQSICLHGDGTHATVFARKIHTALKKAGVMIQSPAHA